MKKTQGSTLFNRKLRVEYAQTQRTLFVEALHSTRTAKVDNHHLQLGSLGCIFYIWPYRRPSPLAAI